MVVELACDNAVFHFNKKHLTDPTVPMWIVKAKGESYYVEHVTCDVPWSTKETPDNTHTKGSIKIKNCLVTIDETNHAVITNLTEKDAKRLAQKDKKPMRIWFQDDFKKTVLKFKHTPIKLFYGTCGEKYYVCDLVSDQDLVFLLLKHHDDFRVLMENEHYYTEYGEWRESNLISKVASLFKEKE